MSLLREIQNECLSKDVDVARLLRLCLTLAARLNQPAIKQWVLNELDGYTDRDALPEYRVFAVRSRGYFADRWIGSGVLEVPVTVLPENRREKFRYARLDQPISSYQSLTDGGDDGGDVLQFPWPVGLAVKYASQMSPMQCVRAWQELPRNAVIGMVDTVKTRVLSMVLELEAQDPSAGDVPATSLKVTEAQVQQIFNTNIFGGNVQSVAAGSTNVQQTGGPQVIQGDFASLSARLQAAGVPADFVEELKSALDGDAKDGTANGLGRRVSAWLKSLPSRLAGAASDVVVGAATTALLAYLGLGS